MKALLLLDVTVVGSSADAALSNSLTLTGTW
jgi:hypothetical protein